MDYIKELEKDFPKAMSNVYCGADLPKGWLFLVREVMPLLEASGCQIAQLKEKFGGLRLYFDYPEDGLSSEDKDKVWQAVRDAERRSFTVCEQCSAPGVTRDGGWLLTLCDPCSATRKEKMKQDKANYKAALAAKKAKKK